MLYDEIPRRVRETSKPIELAILLMYEPHWRNKKDIAYMLNYRSIRQVNKVLRKHSSWIAHIRTPQDSVLLSYIPN